MKKFLQKYFSLSLLFILVSCFSPKECIIPKSNNLINPRPVISLTDDKPVLYRAEFAIFKYDFSGLIAFRRMPDVDQQIRISLISEMGIKIMEFSYDGNTIENTYCMPSIYRKSMVKFVGGFLKLLIYEPQSKKVCYAVENNKEVFYCTSVNEKLRIEMEKKNRKNIFLRKNYNTSLDASYYSSVDELPEHIQVRMKLKTQINLKHVQKAFK